MERKKLGNIEWLEFELLSDIPHLCHGVFLRQGGFSQGPYNSLNASYDVGDCKTQVGLNLREINSVFFNNFSQDIALISAKQCHGKQIASVNKKISQEFLNCDALITNLDYTSLLIKHADCQAALFYDTKNQVIANVHAGWRGSVQNIYRDTIENMKKKYGTCPSELLVCISPSLGPDDAEFTNYLTELPEAFWSYQVRPHYFDFWAISADQLKACGVLTHHIEIASISTYSNSRDYFSYRRENITGRHATCIMMTK